ncbi:MAG TPA: nuclear transport factor 2 family protein [Gammaproteobacteria bacterium]|nr:nuclear transport factor 2 family protein [Gammaproteobacteria bacterium]
MRTLLFYAALLCLNTAQAAVPPQAATDIDAANRDWGTAMVKGDADTVAAAYAPDAVFCKRDGTCYSGYPAILDMTRAALTKGGPMKSAEAHSTRRVEDHGYIYEWGQARMVTGASKTVAGGYFTIWVKQPDGHWKIFRNLVLP